MILCFSSVRLGLMPNARDNRRPGNCLQSRLLRLMQYFEDSAENELVVKKSLLSCREFTKTCDG
jgi:hypothetical protein